MSEPQAELSIRAPRPAIVRLRRGAAITLVSGAGALVAGALCWSFVLAPHLRAAAKAAAAETPAEPPKDAKPRPSELVASQPATYDRLASASIPEPRIFGEKAPPEAQDHRPKIWASLAAVLRR